MPYRGEKPAVRRLINPAHSLLVLLGLAVAACAPENTPGEAPDSVRASTLEHAPTGAVAAAPVCTPPQRTGTLPEILRESSGVAASRRRPGVLWTHNDSGHPAVLFAIDSTGQIIDQVRVEGARNRDWEDIAIGPCPSGECLYLADTGDNLLRYADAAIYRVAEPAPGDSVTGPAERFPLRYPDGPRDVEALYILPDGTLYLVSKGRQHPIELFRYPPPLTPDKPIVLQEIQRLSDRGVAIPYQVTGADATPDGRWVAIRTYSAILLYRPQPDGTLLPALPPPGLILQELLEPQGEGITLRSDGTIFLTSEAGPPGLPGIVGRLECRLP